jgi:hypothetical protein
MVGRGIDAGTLNFHKALVRYIHHSRGYLGDADTNIRSIASSG